ncbi:MAG: ABC transporter permease [Anaerolineae bacterium]|nr:ABC transporter permease [Anaerolineae bacterium]
MIAPYDYAKTDILNSLIPPAFVSGGEISHFFGTDHLGRDIFSRLLFSIRITVMIGFIGTSISAVMGTALGMIAGQLRGSVEEIIMMLVDIQASLPFLVFALTALAILGNSFTVLLIVIGINGWEGYARLARGMVLRIMGEDYILAAKSIGTPRGALYRRYLLPNILSALIVQFTITLAGTILLESALSFLGLGIQTPMTSLGQMLGEGREYLLFAPWLSLVPGGAIFLMILSISIVGDWLRDVMDPTSRH